MSTETRNEAAERLRVHLISGYEWECEECHYHFAFGSGGNRDRICAVCQKEIPNYDEGEVDSTGHPVDHQDLVTREQALEALAAERRATVERIKRAYLASNVPDGSEAFYQGIDAASANLRAILDEEAAR